MELNGRYKQVGKKKYAVLDLPYEYVMDTFEGVLCDSDAVSKLSGSLNRDTGIFKIEYRLSGRKNDVYENYCLLVEVIELDAAHTKIEYVFVYDRLISWYTRLLSLICFVIPMLSSGLLWFKFKLQAMPLYLAIYIPLLLIAAFGVFSLFGYREKIGAVKPMIKEFEQLLMSAFNE